MEKNNNLKIKDVVIAIATIFFLCSLFLAVFQYIVEMIIKAFEHLSKISSKTDAVVVVAVITGGISIITVIISSIISKIIEYKNQTNRYLYEKREKPYSDFINMVYKLQMKTNNNEKYPEEELKNDISKFSESLTLWGSSNVIKKWLKFRKKSLELNSSVDNLFILEEIVYEIRKDMGQKKKGLKKGDILSFFVNDIDKYVNNNKLK